MFGLSRFLALTLVRRPRRMPRFDKEAMGKYNQMD